MEMKARYAKLCTVERSIPIFCQAWWLDAACGVDNWDVVLSTQGDDIIGALPYFIRRRAGGLVHLTQPPLTQFLGPWIRDVGKPSSRLAWEKDVMSNLIQQLPRFDYYSQAWSPQVVNWLPFYWSGFKQTVFYTMRLRNIADHEYLWRNLHSGARTDIRKAERRYNVRLRENSSLQAFLDLNRKTFQRQGLPVPYSEDVVQKIDSACCERACRRMFIAEDAEGRPHAGVYLVWDSNCAYYLMGGGDPTLRSSGATSFCMWEAIKYASSVAPVFDFEGSMMEPVERFFRSFGAEQVPYFRVMKSASFIPRLRDAYLALRG